MLLFCMVALAQPTLEPPAVPSSYAHGWGWLETGPRTVAALADVAIHPERSERWAVVTDDGAVWVTVDGGATWRAVLGGLVGATEEDLAGEVEARLREVGAEVEVPDASPFEDGGELDLDALEQALEDAADEARDASRQAIDDLQGELEGDAAWFLSGEPRAEVRPRVWFTSAGLLVAARADGLRVSVDLGSSWAQALDEPVTALAELPDGRFVLGTPTGLLASSDLARFTPVSGFETVAVADLVEDGGVYAATSDGLWFSSDLFVWRRLSAWRDEALTVRPVAPDGDGARAPRALVVGAEDDLRRASDPVVSPAAGVLGGPVPRASSVARRGALLLAASALGPFESTDAGASWTPLPAGLPGGADARDVEILGEVALLASSAGLFVIAPLPEAAASRPPALAEWVPLPVLVDAGTLRPELSARSGRRWAAALLPVLTLDGAWSQRVADDWDAETWTTRAVDSWWQVRMKLTWRPDRRRGTTGSFDAEALAAGLDVLVIDGEVVLDDGITSDALVSKVNRGATLYRVEVADTITTLWTTRQRLVAERDLAVADEPLVERVALALQVAELEARLDALTGGAVSSWNQNRAAGRRNGGTR